MAITCPLSRDVFRNLADSFFYTSKDDRKLKEWETSHVELTKIEKYFSCLISCIIVCNTFLLISFINYSSVENGRYDVNLFPLLA